MSEPSLVDDPTVTRNAQRGARNLLLIDELHHHPVERLEPRNRLAGDRHQIRRSSRPGSEAHGERDHHDCRGDGHARGPQDTSSASPTRNLKRMVERPPEG
jgi:hypothetical protein